MKKILALIGTLAVLAVATPATAQVTAPVNTLQYDTQPGAATLSAACSAPASGCAAGQAVVVSTQGQQSVVFQVVDTSFNASVNVYVGNDYTGVGTGTWVQAYYKVDSLGAPGSLTNSATAWNDSSTHRVTVFIPSGARFAMLAATVVTGGTAIATPWALAMADQYLPFMFVPSGGSTAPVGSIPLYAQRPDGSFLPFFADQGQRLISGNSNRAGYHTLLTATVPTAAASLVAIEADSSNKLRLRYIKVCLGVGALQTTAGERQLVLFRTTAASSGGSTQTPTIYDPADSAFGGVARYNSSAVTTTPAIGSVTVANDLGWTGTFAFTTAATTTTPQCSEKYFDTGQQKPITVAAGVANGLAIGDLTGGAGGAGVYNVDLGWSVEAN